MWYEVAGVLILKLTVWPTLTLIEVAKPWIEASPTPSTCQSAGASPGLVFSQATLLTTGAAQGSAAEAVPPDSSMPVTARRTTAGIRRSAPRFLIDKKETASIEPKFQPGEY